MAASANNAVVELNNIISWINEKISCADKELADAKKDELSMGMFEDCGDFYRQGVARSEQRVETLWVVKACVIVAKNELTQTVYSVEETVGEIKKLVRDLKKKIVEAKKQIEVAKRENASMGGFEDCGDFYQDEVVRAEQRFDTLLDAKRGIEKYSKKLMHQSKRV